MDLVPINMKENTGKRKSLGPQDHRLDLVSTGTPITSSFHFFPTDYRNHDIVSFHDIIIPEN